MELPEEVLELANRLQRIQERRHKEVLVFLEKLTLALDEVLQELRRRPR